MEPRGGWEKALGGGWGLLNKLTASSPTQLGGQTPPQRGKDLWRVKPGQPVSRTPEPVSLLSWAPVLVRTVEEGASLCSALLFPL